MGIKIREFLSNRYAVIGAAVGGVYCLTVLEQLNSWGDSADFRNAIGTVFIIITMTNTLLAWFMGLAQDFDNIAVDVAWILTGFVYFTSIGGLFGWLHNKRHISNLILSMGLVMFFFVNAAGIDLYLRFVKGWR